VKQSEGCQGFSTAGKTIAAPKGAALFAEWSGAMRPPFFRSSGFAAPDRKNEQNLLR
jgi:hypothetical protein